MLNTIDKRYRFDKYANHNCEPYITGKYSNLTTARWACVRDSRCSAISVEDCNPEQVVGLCTENKIGLEHVPGYCIYKKGDFLECILYFAPWSLHYNTYFTKIHKKIIVYVFFKMVRSITY